MELSETTLTHLRDEAYAFLAKEALLARLEVVDRERASVASTRPPFGGLLSRRESREAFARSMRVVDDNEAVLRDQLTHITGIVDWLRPVIRQDVSTYLAAVSPEYCQILQVVARLNDWERSFKHVPELLVAFARDLRAVRQALGIEPKARALGAYELAALRESAEGLASQEHELLVIEKAAMALAPPSLAPQIVFPEIPNLHRLGWVSRLAVIPPEKARDEVKQAEAETRTFLAGTGGDVVARLQAGRDACAQLAEKTLEDYWNQLRAHARSHYVEELEVSEIISMLSERYIDADIQRYQQAKSLTEIAGR